jgi:hypothetical protein
MPVFTKLSRAIHDALAAIALTAVWQRMDMVWRARSLAE